MLSSLLKRHLFLVAILFAYAASPLTTSSMAMPLESDDSLDSDFQMQTTKGKVAVKRKAASKGKAAVKRKSAVRKKQPQRNKEFESSNPPRKEKYFYTTEDKEKIFALRENNHTFLKISEIMSGKLGRKVPVSSIKNMVNRSEKNTGAKSQYNRFTPEKKEEALRLKAKGWYDQEIAKEVGCCLTNVRGLFKEKGQSSSKESLSLISEQKATIVKLAAEGMSQRDIALQIGRDKSTVSRTLAAAQQEERGAGTKEKRDSANRNSSKAQPKKAESKTTPSRAQKRKQKPSVETKAFHEMNESSYEESSAEGQHSNESKSDRMPPPPIAMKCPRPFFSVNPTHPSSEKGTGKDSSSFFKDENTSSEESVSTLGNTLKRKRGESDEEKKSKKQRISSQPVAASSQNQQNSMDDRWSYAPSTPGYFDLTVPPTPGYFGLSFPPTPGYLGSIPYAPSTPGYFDLTVPPTPGYLGLSFPPTPGDTL